MWSTLWLLFHCLLTVRAYQCNQDPEKMKIIERLLVKDNPTHFMEGRFSDVWASNSITDYCECSNVMCVKKGDGIMEDKTFCRFKTGGMTDVGSELVSETDKIGVYTVNGNLKKEGMRFDNIICTQTINALVYIIHADASSIAFFSCQVVDTNWFVGVQVKSDLKDQLSLDGDNEVKQSFAKAQEKMQEAKKVFTLPQGQDFFMYDLKKLC